MKVMLLGAGFKLQEARLGGPVTCDGAELRRTSSKSMHPQSIRPNEELLGYFGWSFDVLSTRRDLIK